MTEIVVIVANSFISDHDDVGGASVCTHPVCVIVLVTNIIIVHCVL